MVHDVDEFVVEGHGGGPRFPQRAVLLLRPGVGLQVPLTFFQEILSALDLHAEAAHVEDPQGDVDLGCVVVPLPFVVGEAGEAAGFDFVEDAGFGPAHGVVPPVGRERYGMRLHEIYPLKSFVFWGCGWPGRPFTPGWCGRDRRGGTAGTGRGAFDYLLLGCGWGPVRSPGRGPPAANAWLTPASPGRPARW